MSLANQILPAEQVDLFFGLGKSFEKTKSSRSHFAGSLIKVIYNIYQYHKRYDSVFPSAKKQAESIAVNLCEKTVYRVVNSKIFRIFGHKVNRDFSSNAYKLHPWVIECFQNLEKLGFMKHFATDFKRWLKLWRMQIPRFVVNRLLNILTWSDLFENKRQLFTKRRDRCPTKGKIDVPLLGSKISSLGSLEDGIRETTNPFSAKHAEAISILERDIGMKQGDIHYVSNYLGLRDILGGLKILQERIAKGWKIESPIKTFMHSVKTFKNLRKN